MPCLQFGQCEGGQLSVSGPLRPPKLTGWPRNGNRHATTFKKLPTQLPSRNKNKPIKLGGKSNVMGVLNPAVLSASNTRGPPVLCHTHAKS